MVWIQEGRRPWYNARRQECPHTAAKPSRWPRRQRFTGHSLNGFLAGRPRTYITWSCLLFPNCLRIFLICHKCTVDFLWCWERKRTVCNIMHKIVTRVHYYILHVVLSELTTPSTEKEESQWAKNVSLQYPCWWVQIHQEIGNEIKKKTQTSVDKLREGGKGACSICSS